MKKKKNSLHDYIKYTSLGFEFLACILIFIGIGYGLDQWADTQRPWFLLVFSLLGCAAALYLLIRKLGNPK